jgi:hypothetical protein
MRIANPHSGEDAKLIEMASVSDWHVSLPFYLSSFATATVNSTLPPFALNSS